MNKIRVLLADDHNLFREGMADFLNGQPDFSLVGEAGDGLEAIEKARELRPDLILMDIGMPRCDGLEATQRIKGEMQDVVIVMLTMRDEDEKRVAAIKRGAQGYLLKSARSCDMVDLLRDAVKGNATISQALAGRLLEEFRHVRHFVPQVSPEDEIVLTRQEEEVLSLVADGATEAEIAEALTLNVPTVRSQMRDILAKLHLRHRHEVARSALREGSIAQPSPGHPQV